jgi:MFS transporter, ACS family, D-galactonate transporter
MLVDRYPVKRTYALAFTAWSLVSVATAWAGSLGALVAMRVLLGVAEAVVTPASLRWIRTNMPESQRGLAIGVFQAGTKAGSAVGAPVCAWLIVHFGWRAMFLVLGAGSMLWLIPWMVIAEDQPSPPSKAPEQGPRLRDLLRLRAVWAVILGTFCYSYFAYFCVTWLPAYFVERRGLSLTSMGAYTFLSFFGIAAMTPLAGWAADRIIARGGDPVRVRRNFIIAGFLLASTEVLGAHTESRTVAVGVAVFSLTALGLASANYWAITQTLVPGAAAGRMGGLQNFASNFAGLVSPLVAGWLIDAAGGYERAMHAIWFVLLAGVLIYATLIPRSSLSGRYKAV